MLQAHPDEPPHGSREAALAVWRWRDGSGEAAAAAKSKALRRHGAVRGAIALAVGTAFAASGHTVMAAVVGTIAAVTVLSALLSPAGLYTRLNAAVAWFARGVGTALTYILLVPVYALFITPFGLAMRRGSRDPLHRTWSSQTASFWTLRPATDDAPERRKRPF